MLRAFKNLIKIKSHFKFTKCKEKTLDLDYHSLECQRLAATLFLVHLNIFVLCPI